MKTLLITWLILSSIPTIRFTIRLIVFRNTRKQFEWFVMWLVTEILLFLISIPVSLIILLFNFLET